MANWIRTNNSKFNIISEPNLPDLPKDGDLGFYLKRNLSSRIELFGSEFINVLSDSFFANTYVQNLNFFRELFKEKFIRPHPKINVISTILKEITDNNIGQLIEFVDFVCNEDEQDENIQTLITEFMTTAMVNNICRYMDIELKNSNTKLLKKICRILSVYSNPLTLLICYKKFFQTRIMDLTYNNLELELELIEKIPIGEDSKQNLRNQIMDITNSKNFITGSISHPIVLTPQLWLILNKSKLNIILPQEIASLDKNISEQYPNINLQPTMGMAEFKAILSNQEIQIKCNILQAIALSYLNDNSPTTIQSFSSDTLIILALGEKIFQSLLKANLINLDMESYAITINTKYSGPKQLDLIKMF